LEINEAANKKNDVPPKSGCHQLLRAFRMLDIVIYNLYKKEVEYKENSEQILRV